MTSASFHAYRSAIDIVVPTYGRPHKIAAVAENIRANTVNEHQIHFVVEASDTDSFAAVIEAGCLPFLNEGARSYSGAMNTAYRYTEAEWIFAGADDLDFERGWDAAALTCAAANPWAAVIGTDDLMNPYVRQGVHATHYLVRRSYLDNIGGCVDEGPRSFLHEGYGHNYCDTEFIGTAKARCTFRPCFESIVKHLHTSIGLTPHDATHDKAEATYGADAERYEQRRPLWWNISR
jgi:glycosyltransferase involved in cell wall biosynthesis